MKPFVVLTDTKTYNVMWMNQTTVNIANALTPEMAWGLIREMAHHKHVAVTPHGELVVREDAETERELLRPVKRQALERPPTGDVANLHDLKDFLEPHEFEEARRQFMEQAVCRFFMTKGGDGEEMSRLGAEDARRWTVG